MVALAVREALILMKVKIYTIFVLVFACIFPAFAVAAGIHLPRTGLVTSYGTGDDGAIQAGVIWPSPRFIDNADGTVNDMLTGLTWLKHANCFSTKTWTTALSTVNTLATGTCGLTDGSAAGDWRLPNISQLESLIDISRTSPALPVGHPFSSVQSAAYWSSTTYITTPSNAFYSNMSDGSTNYASKATSYSVWPIRAGQLWLQDNLIVSIKGSPYFGALAPEGTPVVREVMLKNTGGTDLSVTSISITGANPTDFSVAVGGASPCGNLTPTITASGHCTVNVTFTPTYGPKSANLTITANSKSVDVPITGTTGPPDTSITGKPAVLTNIASASFTFSASISSPTFECKMDSGSFVSCATPTTYNDLTSGIHTFYVRALDPGSNPDPTPASYTWTIDLTAPDTTINNKPSTPTSNTSASFAFFSNDATAIFECKLDSGSFVSCATPTTYTNLVEGNHTFQVRAIDPAGNVDPTPASWTWTVSSAATSTVVIHLPRTGESVSSATGDDGSIQIGVIWPSPRFIDNSDGTISDMLTGLTWLKNANCFSTKTWTTALSSVNSLATGTCGLTDGSAAGDWRLPNINQLESLIDISRTNPAIPTGHPFSSVQSAAYWSSTTYITTPSNAFYASMSDGSANYAGKGTSYNVWPVRAGQFWLQDSLVVSIKGSPYFGALAPEGTPVSREVTLKNTGGTDLSVTSILITGANPTDFSVAVGGASPCGNLTPTITAGGNCTVNVTFTPTYGLKSANLTISANSKSVNVPVTGTTGPPDTSITGKPAALTNSASASFAFSANISSPTYECKLDSGSFVSCPTPTTYTGLAGGSHTFSVRALDPGSNPDPTPASYTWTIDLTAPDTTINNKPGTPTSNTSASFAFFSNDATAVFECKLDSGSFVSCATPTTYTNLAEGNHTFQVRAIDPAGNQDLTPANWMWTIDFTAPNAPTVAGTSPTNNAKPTWIWTSGGEGNGIYQYQLDSTTWNSTAETTFTPSNILFDGAHTIYVQEQDAAGNWSLSGYKTIIIDTIGPVLELSMLAAGAVTNNNILNIAGSATDINGVQTLTLISNSSNTTLDPAGFSHAIQLTNGTNNITVTAADVLGNVSNDSRSITYDANAPLLTITAPADNSTTKNSTVEITGSMVSGATVAVAVNDGSAQSALFSGTTYTYTTNLLPGMNTLEVIATDSSSHVNHQKRTIFSDYQGATLNITSPGQDSATVLPSVQFNGTVEDAPADATVSIETAGHVYIPVLSSGTFSQAVSLATEQTNSITVAVHDGTTGDVIASSQRNVIRNTVTLTSNLISPQVIGANITFTAEVQNTPGNYEYKFWLKANGVWTAMQGYSTSNTWTWDTTGATAGAYGVQVYVRNVGSSAKYDATKNMSYSLCGPATGATLSPGIASPQVIGNNHITFTAGGIGCSGNYEYRFWLKANGVWSSRQGYSTTNTWTWDTSGATTGTYGVQVYVRNVGSSAKYEATKTLSYVLSYPPASGTTLSPDMTSPQTAGANITFTAGGVGGSGNYEFRFWLKAAGVWTTVQAYSIDNTWTWDTTGLAPDTYRVQVYVRNVGSSEKYDAVLGTGYVIK